MLLRNFILLVTTAVLSLLCYQKAQWNRYAVTISEAMAIVERNYVEPVEGRQLFEDAMSGMVRGLDVYSAFVPPKQYDEFQEGLDQHFGGIGVMVEVHPETNRPTVISPLIDSPAYHVGIRAGDTILAIDGTDTRTLRLRDAVERIHGKVGEPVTLTVRHRGEETPIDLTIVRAEIKTDSVLGDSRRPDGSWDFFVAANPRIKLIRITTFGERTVDELAKALAAKSADGREAEAVIIDLRDNSGGLLTSGIGVCDLLLDEGVIVSTRGRGGLEGQVFRARPELAISKTVPMVVLVNGFSASASEIVAACLQDHGRAAIAGRRTWGKGTVQTVIPLEGGKSALKLTTASYWRPSNRNIHRMKNATESDAWGVTPDEGLDVEIPEDIIAKVYRYRRYRDAYHAPGEEPAVSAAPERQAEQTPSSEDGGDDAASESSFVAPEPIEDPQLRRAIEYLEEKMKSAKG